MSALFPVSFQFTLDDQVSSALGGMETAFAEVESSAQAAGGSIDGLQSGFQRAADGSYTLTDATNDQVDAFACASSQAKDINAQYGYVTETSKSMGSSILSNVQSANSLAMAGVNLYLVTDRIQNSQVALDRANLNVEKSTQSLKVAQDHASEAGVALDAATDKLSEAIDQYGAGSVEAQKAQDDLTAAQTKYQDATTQVQIKTEALTVSQERADMAQRNFNATLLTSSLSVIPSVISIGTQAYQMYDKWQNSTSALDNSTQGLNGTLGGNANASNGASSSGGGLASTLGLLSLAVASVGTSLALTNQKLDDAAAKGAKFSDVEKDTYTASMALGGGIGVYLGSQITSFLGLLDQSDAALDKLATKFEEQNTPIQDVINGLTNLGYSKASIDSVVASMQNMSDVSSQVASQVTVNMLTITTAVNGATTAVSTTTGITGTGATAIPTSGGTLPNEYQPPVGGGGSGVHMYEAGGIATREQLAVLAEQEPEAVIPLSELGDIASIGVGRNQIPQHITNNITLQIGNISNEVDLDKIPEKVSEGIAEFYRRRSY